MTGTVYEVPSATGRSKKRPDEFCYLACQSLSLRVEEKRGVAEGDARLYRQVAGRPAHTTPLFVLFSPVNTCPPDSETRRAEYPAKGGSRRIGVESTKMGSSGGCSLAASLSEVRSAAGTGGEGEQHQPLHGQRGNGGLSISELVSRQRHILTLSSFVAPCDRVLYPWNQLIG